MAELIPARDEAEWLEARRQGVTASEIASGDVIARRDVYEVREHVRKASTTDKLVPVYPKPKRES